MFGDGNDTVRGGQVDDEVCREAGDDLVAGNEGDDRCDGGAGANGTANANNCKVIVGTGPLRVIKFVSD